MKLLAIETSTMLGGVAVISDDELIAEARLNVKTTHSERLLGEVDRALKASFLEMDDIDVVAVSIGPGSFTGLRVGLSTAKGLVYASRRKLVSVPTLEALAWNLPFSGHPICAVFDARRNEVYAGIFEWRDHGFERTLSERTMELSGLLSLIKSPTIFLGDGAGLFRDRIENVLGPYAIFGQPHNIVPSPSATAVLGMRRAKNELFDDPDLLVPMYLRKSEAEIKFGSPD